MFAHLQNNRKNNRSTFEHCVLIRRAFGGRGDEIVAAGLVDIDAPVASYADPVLRKQNGTTLLELWNGDRTILNVTARMLMGMRGGLEYLERLLSRM